MKSILINCFLLFVVLTAVWAEVVIENDYHVDMEPAEQQPDKVRRVVVKTYTLPTRVKNPPLWYRPDWKLLTSTTTTTQAPTELPQTTTPCATTTDSKSITDEPWLLEAIEEVAQQTAAQLSLKDTDYTPTTFDDNSNFIDTVLSTEAGITINKLGFTTTPSPVSISSGPIWIFPTKTPNNVYLTEETTPAAPLNTWTVTDPPASTTTATVRTTTKTMNDLVSTIINKPIPTRTQFHRSTSGFNVGEAEVLQPTTKDWWMTQPNFQFATLTVHDREEDSPSYDYGDTEGTPAKVERPSELNPPSRPQFNFQEDQSPSIKRPHQIHHPPPRRPTIIKAPPRTTTSTTTTTTTTTTPIPPVKARPKKPPALVPVRQTGTTFPPFQDAQFIPSPTGSTDSLVTDSSTGEPTTDSSDPPTNPSADAEASTIDQINLVIVNLWNYVNGQLTLMGQQLVPAQVLAGVNITNGATIQSSNLPASVLGQLSEILQSGTTPPTTTTTTTTSGPPRPYGGVGNPSLVGVIQTIERNNSVKPNQGYGLPKPPSQAYGLPEPPSASYNSPQSPSSSYGAPSQSYGVPSQTYGAPSQSYGVPSQTYGAPPAPSTAYGAPSKGGYAGASSIFLSPQSAIYISKQPKPTMNQFEEKKPVAPVSTAGSPTIVNINVPNRVPSPGSQSISVSTLHLTGAPPDPPLGLPIRTPPTPKPFASKPTVPTKVNAKPTTKPAAVGNNKRPISGTTTASTAFAPGGNPLGALLPDFILESLAQAHSTGGAAPLGTLPKSGLSSSSSAEFASRLGDSFPEPEEETAGKEFPTENMGIHERIEMIRQQMEGRSPRPLHFTSDLQPKTTGVISTSSGSQADPVNIVASTRYPSAMEMAYVAGNLKQFSPAVASNKAQGITLLEPDNHNEVPTTTPGTAIVTSSSTPTVTRDATNNATAPAAKPERRFSIHNISGGMVALAAMFPATALALPILIGRKRRDFGTDESSDSGPLRWLIDEEIEDGFLKKFTLEHESELSQMDIATSSCRQLVDSENSNKHLILCPGRNSRALNMIILED